MNTIKLEYHQEIAGKIQKKSWNSQRVITNSI